MLNQSWFSIWKVCSLHKVSSLGGNRVRVLPATDLGLGWAAIRSILKNFSLGWKSLESSWSTKNTSLAAFFFPVCFSLLFLPFSRTLYDIMARSIGIIITFVFQPVVQISSSIVFSCWNPLPTWPAKTSCLKPSSIVLVAWCGTHCDSFPINVVLVVYETEPSLIHMEIYNLHLGHTVFA